MKFVSTALSFLCLVAPIGARASEAVEQIAEDGDATKLAKQFSITRGTVWDGNVGDGPICPGDEVKLDFTIKVPTGAPYFLSYASMVLPSNDTFLANAMPRAYRVSNSNARPQGPVEIFETGSDVFDAGTEVNDEKAMNTGALGQMTPNTGMTEYDAIRPHKGFNPKGSGGILDDPRYVNADFTAPDYKMMKVYIEIYDAMGESMDMMNP